MPWVCWPVVARVAASAAATVRHPVLHPVRTHRAIGRAVRRHWKRKAAMGHVQAVATWQAVTVCVWVGTIGGIGGGGYLVAPPVARGAGAIAGWCCSGRTLGVVPPGGVSLTTSPPSVVGAAHPPLPVTVGRPVNVPEPPVAAILIPALIALGLIPRRKS